MTHHDVADMLHELATRVRAGEFRQWQVERFARAVSAELALAHRITEHKRPEKRTNP